MRLTLWTKSLALCVCSQLSYKEIHGCYYKKGDLRPLPAFWHMLCLFCNTTMPHVRWMILKTVQACYVTPELATAFEWKKKKNGGCDKVKTRCWQCEKEKLFVYKMRTYVRFRTHPRGIIGWKMRGWNSFNWACLLPLNVPWVAPTNCMVCVERLNTVPLCWCARKLF